MKILKNFAFLAGSVLIFGLFCMSLTNAVPAYAQAQNPAPADAGDEQKDFAAKPSECGYTYCGQKKRNCLFLEEPIGGKYNYDLFIVDCKQGSCSGNTYKPEGHDSICNYAPYNGGAVPQGSTVKQAILTEDKSKPYQGPFGLLYSYVQLIYAYMSGLIVGISVLFVVVGGVQMSISGGDEAKFTAGKSRIVKAIVGIIIWFTASLILYTINPTFFAF
jgi:hypothetical protein